MDIREDVGDFSAGFLMRFMRFDLCVFQRDDV